MRSKEGFTLIELMVIVLMIGVLAGLAIPTYKTMRQWAVGAEATAIMKQLVDAEIIYFLDKGHYFPPSPGEVLTVIHGDPPDTDAIKAIRDALSITLPVNHNLDFTITNMLDLGVMITINGRFPIFKNGAESFALQVDMAGNISPP